MWVHCEVWNCTIVELLNSQWKDLECLVALFDESFNCVAKKTNKWSYIVDFEILTKTLWLQGTIV